MLERPFWEVPNLVALLQHSNNSWSSPSGWARSLGRLSSQQRRDTHRLWFLLTSMSVAFFIALPLSGLAMEQSDGYIHVAIRPEVIGRTWDDFNSRDGNDYFKNAKAGWEIGSTPALPGFGVLYSPKSLKHNEHNGLQKVPNSLLLNDSMSEMFLAPQGENPVVGKEWGLRAGYRCDIVNDISI